MTEAKLDHDKLTAFIGDEVGPFYGWDPVNAPMIRHWCEAMGDPQPAYLDRDFDLPAATAGASSKGQVLAPPTMLQAWTMRGFADEYPEGSTDEDPYEILSVLAKAGFTNPVAVNCQQTYHRYFLEGEYVYSTAAVKTVSPQKKTALGEGYFVEFGFRFLSTGAQRRDAEAEDECVAEMVLRLLIYAPPANTASAQTSDAPAKPQKIMRPRPAINQDNRFFWEGLKESKLLVQQCKSCSTMRHPPEPMCTNCHSLKWAPVEISGEGEVYSFVNFHHPQIPPFDSPNPIALVELEKGVRIVAGLKDVKPKDVEIGMPVEVEFVEDGDLTLALFKPKGA